MALSGSFTGTTANNFITPKIVWSATQSLDDNTSTITVNLYYTKSSASASPTYGTLTGAIKIGTYSQAYSKYVQLSPGATILLATFKQTVPHDSDGKLSITLSATGAISGTSLSSTTISSEVTLDTIPRASTLSVVAGTLGVEQTLTVTRQSDNFAHTIIATCGTSTINVTSTTPTTDTSIAFEPPIEWASQNTGGDKVSVTYRITTYANSTSGSGMIGDKTYTVAYYIPNHIKPEVTITVSDDTGYATKYNGYIQGKSRLKIDLDISPAYGSPIQSRKVTVGGTTYTITSDSFTTSEIMNEGDIEVSVSITDARSRTGTSVQSITVLPYASPKITRLSVGRCDEDGTDNEQGEHIKIAFDSVASDISNYVTYILQYKKTSDAEYSDPIALDDYAELTLLTDATYVLNPSTSEEDPSSGHSYDILLTVVDDFGSTDRKTSVSTAFTIMHFRADGTGIAMGKVSELPNAVEIAMPLYDGRRDYGPEKESFGLPRQGQFESIIRASFGIWSYRIWSNGDIDMWGSYDIRDVPCQTQLGSMYRSAEIAIPDFPFPIVGAQVVSSYSSDGYGAMLWVTKSATDTRPPYYYLVRPTSATIATGKITLYIKGMWET